MHATLLKYMRQLGFARYAKDSSGNTVLADPTGVNPYGFAAQPLGAGSALPISARKTALKNWFKADMKPNGTTYNSEVLTYRGGWQASTAYVENDYIVLGNGLRMICSAAGTSGVTMPAALTPAGTTLKQGTVITNTVTDGTVTWFTPDPTMDLLSIAAGTATSKTKFVAVGSDGRVIGGNGDRWALALTIPGTLTSTLRRVTYGNAWFIVGDSNATNATVATLTSSGTGVTDRSTTAGYGNFNLYGVAAKAVDASTTLYMAVGDGNDGSGHAKILKATYNGSTWTFTTSSPATLPNKTFRAIAYMANVGKWVAVGDDGTGTTGFIYVSADDGVTWAAASVLPVTISPKTFNSICYDSTTGVAMMVGADVGSNKAIIVSTSDGATFNVVASSVSGAGYNPTGTSWEAVHYDIAGYADFWLSTGGDNHVWVSTDGGATWAMSGGATAGYLGANKEFSARSVAVSPEDGAFGHRWVIGSDNITANAVHYGARAAYSMAVE